MIARVRYPLLAFAASAILAGSACAPRRPAPAPSPADLAALEAAHARHPADPRTATDLGAARYAAGDFAKARDVLRAALALDPRHTRAAILLGLTHEQLGHLDSARAAYTAAQATASRRDRAELAARQDALTRRELALDARRLVQAESALAATPPEAGTVAVLPWRYIGPNEELRPLERGLAHLVIADLAKVSRLRLLERERVQALTDEMRLTDSDRVAPATGARSGRLLGAAQVVQGVIVEGVTLDASGQIGLEANMVNAADASIAATGSAADRLPKLLALEKEVVFELLDRLGLALTPGERRAIAERPTADLQAFLAFSRGLEREDAGDFTGAAREYEAATARDRGFHAARARRAAALRLSAAAAPGDFTRRLADADLLGRGGIGRTGVLRGGVQGTVPSAGGALDTRIRARPPLTRPALPEALQQDSPDATGLTGEIIIIIQRP